MGTNGGPSQLELRGIPVSRGPPQLPCTTALTRMMSRMAATPDVAMTLALLGTRLSSVGMMVSAPWSKRIPNTEDRCLGGGGRGGDREINHCETADAAATAVFKGQICMSALRNATTNSGVQACATNHPSGGCSLPPPGEIHITGP